MAKRGKSSNGADMASALGAIEHANAIGINGLLDEGIASARRVAQERQSIDSQVYSADEMLAQLICLPMPALAPRFLLQGEGWPLGRFFVIDGLPESCKSAFAGEVGTWHRQAAGHYVVIETEEKDGSELRDSFFNYDRGAWSATRSATQDAWNEAFFWWVAQLKGIYDGYDRPMTEEERKTDDRREARKQKQAESEDGHKLMARRGGRPVKPAEKTVRVAGRGQVAPVALVVDSISATLLSEHRDEMISDGSPSQHHPIGAKRLADFFRVAPKEYAGYPITFMAISHLREVPDQRQSFITNRVTTGGQQLKFQMTTEIEMKRLQKHEGIYSHHHYGEIYSIPLRMTVWKNSLGGHAHLDVSMVWYFDPDDRNPLTGERRQKSSFDWHSASIHLLLDCIKPGEAGMGWTGQRAKQLRELVDLRKDSTKDRIWCPELDIGKDSPVTAHEAGAILEARIRKDDDFCRVLYDLMGIRRRRMFKPGIDFREQINSHLTDLTNAEKWAAARLQAAAGDVVPLPQEPGDPTAEAPPI